MYLYKEKKDTFQWKNWEENKNQSAGKPVKTEILCRTIAQMRDTYGYMLFTI